jgi:RNA polymerase sigma factor (sigma-70 family)
MAGSTGLSDAELVQLAAAGDDSGFAALYERYFDRVYDFARRMLRDADDAADVAQESFVKAMGALGRLKDPNSFKTWIFSIARNTALNRIEQSGRVVHDREDADEGESLLYRQVDPNAFGDPESYAEAQESSALVWEAAAGLDPKQYAVLHMQLREGLDSAEIAEALGVSKGNAYTMVSRVKDAMEEAVQALYMTRVGAKDCPTLALLVQQMTGGMTPDYRKQLARHIQACDTCEEKRKKVRAAAVFAAFPPVLAPLDVRAAALEAARMAWQTTFLPTADAAAAISSVPASVSAAGRGAGRRLLSLRLVAGLAAAFSVLIAGAVIAVVAADGGDGDQQVAAISGTPDESDELESPAADATKEETTTPTPTATPSPTPAAAPTMPAAQPPIANPTGPPDTPPVAAPAQLSLSFTSANFDGPGSVELLIGNAGQQALNWQVGAGAPPWLSIAPAGGTVGPGAQATVVLSLAEGALGPGTYDGTLNITSNGGSGQVAVTANLQPPPDTTPPALRGNVTCAFTGSMWRANGTATASDDSGIDSVTMTVDSFGTDDMALNAGTWFGSLLRQVTPPPDQDWSITATDGAGNVTTITGTASCLP